jgi:hypothetical protein
MNYVAMNLTCIHIVALSSTPMKSQFLQANEKEMKHVHLHPILHQSEVSQEINEAITL